MEESNFLGLISDKNILSAIFTKDETSGQLGFAVLNDFFSEKLFPGISTLMPNLVYCYLIFSLTWNEEPKTDDELNDSLFQLSSSNGKYLIDQNKGFHGKVKENVVGTYRRFMERYGFFVKDKDSQFGKLNSQYTSQSRYQKVKKMINKIPAAIMEPNLQPYEIKDMVQRCLIASGIKYEIVDDKKIKILNLGSDNPEKFSPSLFDLAVFKIACEWKEKENEIIIKLKSEKTSKKANMILKFEELESIFVEQNGSLVSKNETIKSLFEYYKAARFASVIQYYIKCRSNHLIKDEKRRLRGEEISKEKKDLEKESLAFIGNFSWNEDDLENMIKLFEEREDCKKKMELLQQIYIEIKKDSENPPDEIIWKIIRDSESSEETAWNRGEITEYLDTYRWEYRPQKSELEKDKNTKAIFERTVGKNTKCASYFIGELCRYGEN